LSLVYKNPHYSSALARLDHLGAEQLVIARAQLAVGTKTSIEQAFERLQSLNRRFENTPEIIGLLALVYNALAYTSKDNTNDLLQSALRQANQALALDPTNLDGLTALYTTILPLRVYVNRLIALMRPFYATTPAAKTRIAHR
jgi:hypothetical protein